MIIIWFLLFAAPLTLLIHELGHLLGAYFVKAQQIHLYVGAGKNVFSFSVGRFSIHIHALYMLGGRTVSERNPYYSKPEQVIIAFLGPLLNGLVGVILNNINLTKEPTILELFILFNFWLCIINLIPYRIGSQFSDGFMIVRTLIKKGDF